jgi:hypothetical protein
MALESHNSTLDTVLPAMDFVLEQFEVFKDHPFLGPMFDSGWAKMDKYYTLTDESRAIILNPNFKWQYIQSNWKLDWLPRTRTMMEEFWHASNLLDIYTYLNSRANPRTRPSSSNNDSTGCAATDLSLILMMNTPDIVRQTALTTLTLDLGG